MNPFDIWLENLARFGSDGDFEVHGRNLAKLVQAYRKAWTYGMLNAPKLTEQTAKEIAKLEAALMGDT